MSYIFKHNTDSRHILMSTFWTSICINLSRIPLRSRRCFFLLHFSETDAAPRDWRHIHYLTCRHQGGFWGGVNKFDDFLLKLNIEVEFGAFSLYFRRKYRPAVFVLDTLIIITKYNQHPDSWIYTINCIGLLSSVQNISSAFASCYIKFMLSH